MMLAIQSMYTKAAPSLMPISAFLDTFSLGDTVSKGLEVTTIDVIAGLADVDLF